MNTYQVTAGATIFGTYQAATEQEARDLCAMDAGYKSEADMEEQTGRESNLIATEA